MNDIKKMNTINICSVGDPNCGDLLYYHFDKILDVKTILYDEISELKISSYNHYGKIFNSIPFIIQKFVNVKKIIFIHSICDIDCFAEPLSKLKKLQVVDIDVNITNYSKSSFLFFSTFCNKLKKIKFVVYDEISLVKYIDILSKSNTINEIYIICKYPYRKLFNVKNVIHKIFEIKYLVKLSFELNTKQPESTYNDICDIIANQPHNLTHFSLIGNVTNIDLLSYFYNSNLKYINITSNSYFSVSQESLPEIILKNKNLVSIHTNYKLNSIENVNNLCNALKINDTLEQLHLPDDYINFSLYEIIETLNVNKTLKSIKLGKEKDTIQKYHYEKIINFLKNNRTLEEFIRIDVSSNYRERLITKLCMINRLINAPINWQYMFFDKMIINAYWNKNMTKRISTGHYKCELVWCESSKNLLLDFKKNVMMTILCVKFKKYIRPPKHIYFAILKYMWFDFLTHVKLTLCTKN